MELRLSRLRAGDWEAARKLFGMLEEVFNAGESGLPVKELGEAYLVDLLSSESFWALAAFDGDQIIGGITAHVLPMTRAEYSELFVYDVAVRPEHQRKGVGRRLITELRTQARAEGISDVFVLADNEDLHALDFYRAVGASAAPVTAFTFSDPAT